MSAILTNTVATHIYAVVVGAVVAFFVLRRNRTFLNASLASLAAKTAQALANKAK